MIKKLRDKYFQAKEKVRELIKNNQFTTNRRLIGVALFVGAILFLNIATVPTIPFSEKQHLKIVLYLAYALLGLLGVVVVVWIVWRMYVFIISSFNKVKPQTNTTAPAPATPPAQTSTSATPAASAPVVKETNYFPWFVVAVMIGVGYVFVFVFPKKPDLLFDFVDLYQANFENVAPYLFAPVIGVAMFFLSKQYQKKFGASLMMMVLVAGAIALWMHPDVLQGLLEPFAMREPVGDLVSGKVWKFYATSFVLFLVAAWNGYAPHAVVIFLLVFIFLAR